MTRACLALTSEAPSSSPVVALVQNDDVAGAPTLAQAVQLLRQQTAAIRLRTLARRRMVVEVPRGALPDAADGVWLFAEDGRWFEPPRGGRVNLARRAQLARLLHALLALRTARPGAAISVVELVAAAWPGQRLLAKAAAARVYTSIRYLRNLGVEILATTTDGYLLDPSAAISVVRRG